MWLKKSFIIKFLLKSAIYLGLIAVVYFYQIIEVQNKYAKKLTNIAMSEKLMKDGIKPPFMTLCFGPLAKQDVLDKYNLNKAALNEPNSAQKKILNTLNKTLEKFFMEATYKLDKDFKLYMIWWDYDIDISFKKKRGRNKPAERLILYNPLKDKQNVTSCEY